MPVGSTANHQHAVWTNYLLKIKENKDLCTNFLAAWVYAVWTNLNPLSRKKKKKNKKQKTKTKTKQNKKNQKKKIKRGSAQDFKNYCKLYVFLARSLFNSP
jgi:leucyl aminopeptidase